MNTSRRGRNGRLDATSLSLRLQEAGASPNKAKDCLEQLQENLRHQWAIGTTENCPSSSGNHDEPVVTPDQSADAIAWAQLRRKLGAISRGAGKGSLAARQSIGLGKILEFTKPRSIAIPADVLAEAQHLQEYLKTTLGLMIVCTLHFTPSVRFMGSTCYIV